MRRRRALQPPPGTTTRPLRIAQRLRRASDEDPAEVRHAFLDLWRAQGQHPFRVEEMVLLPAFTAHRDPEDERVGRMLIDHVRIRLQAQRLEQARDEVPR